MLADRHPRLSWLPTFAAWVAIGALATFGLRAAAGPVVTARTVVLGLHLGVSLPILMALAMVVVGAVLALIVTTIGVLFASVWGRSSGVASLLREIGSVCTGLLPGYVRVLVALRRPRLWGAIVGVLLGGIMAAVEVHRSASPG